MKVGYLRGSSSATIEGEMDGVRSGQAISPRKHKAETLPPCGLYGRDGVSDSVMRVHKPKQPVNDPLQLLAASHGLQLRQLQHLNLGSGGFAKGVATAIEETKGEPALLFRTTTLGQHAYAKFIVGDSMNHDNFLAASNQRSPEGTRV